jgi:hypothetical protein
VKTNSNFKGIPEDIKKQVNEIVRHFNETQSQDRACYYETRYEGRYLYLDRKESHGMSPICRLKYTGKMDDWEFAIYKYSSDRYDTEEWFFPGMECVDGTIEGAMKAGLEAYPVERETAFLTFGKWLEDLKRLFKI